MRLEHLFPVMYPGHEYVGLNHAALIDCRQTRLVCEGFEQLCRPVGEREGKWRPENIAKPSQRSVLDWAKKADDVQNGMFPRLKMMARGLSERECLEVLRDQESR